ncbi:MAG: S8 family serine peptidase, partial [bacterium]|nr:S8 family serine peptidase [bacterium]
MVRGAMFGWRGPSWRPWLAALVAVAALLALSSSETGAAPQDDDLSPPPAPVDPLRPGEGLLPDLLEPQGDPLTPTEPSQAYHNLGSQLSTLAVLTDARRYGAGEGLPASDLISGALPPTLPGGSNATISASAPILLTIQLDGHQDAVIAFLARHGITPVNVASHYIEASVPPTLLARLAEQRGVARVREMPIPQRNHGRVTSRGVALHGAPLWHHAGHEGQGVKVGVIDTVSRPKHSDGRRTWAKDGFVGLRALMGTELPSTVKGICFAAPGVVTHDLANCDTKPSGTIHYDDHGTRVAETLMDVAPKAELYVSNASTWADLQRAVVWMHGQGVKVIVYSIGWTFHGHADGSSPITPSALNTVKWATDNGIVWVNSAGNDADGNWFGAFTDADNDGYHEWDFEPDRHDEGQSLYWVGDGRFEMTAFMRWDDTWGGASTDLDLELMHRPTPTAAWTVVARSANVQNGGAADYPSEGFTYEGGRGQYIIAVKKRAGSAAPAWLQFRLWGGPSALEHIVAASSLSSPSDSTAPGMLAVGAAHVWEPDRLASYSSQGPTPDGRMKPDL